MRLWHYAILDYLPKAQLVAQWRECVCIAKSIYDNGTPNHILVNRIMDYPINEFNTYCNLVVRAMLKRGYNVSSQSIEKLEEYIDFRVESVDENERIFKDWHDNTYMEVCYYNLYEKWHYAKGNSKLTNDEWGEFCVGVTKYFYDGWEMKKG